MRSPLLPVTLAAALAAGASGPPATPRFSGTVEVNVVTVEVSVTRRGVPVTDLGPADFEVFEDGERRRITNFALVEEGALAVPPVPSGAEAPPPPEPQRLRRLVALVFDLGGVRRPELVRAVAAARRYVRSEAGGGIRWAVAVIGPEAEVELPFDGDVERVLAALDRVAATAVPAPTRTVDRSLLVDPLRTMVTRNADAGPGSGAGPGRADLEVLADFAAWEEARQRLADVGRLVRGLGDLFRATAAVPGLKSCLLFSGNLDLGAGLLLDTSASPAGGSGAVHRRTGDTIRTLARIKEAAAALADLANATGWRIDAVPVAGLAAPTAGTFAAEAGGRASLRDETAGPTVLAGRTPVASPEAVPRRLAESTGGALWRGNDLDAALARAHRTLTTFYSIGFPSPRRGAGRRRIEVRVRRRGLEVHARRSHFGLTAADAVASQLAAPLHLLRAAGELPVAVRAALQEGGDRPAQVLVEVPLARLALVPEGDRARGEAEVVVGFHDAAGEPLAVLRRRQSVTVPEALSGRLGGRPLAALVATRAPEGAATVTAAVVDRATGSWGLATVPLAPGPPLALPTPPRRAAGRPLVLRVEGFRRPPTPAPRPTPRPPETGPLRWLLTAAERAALDAAATPEARREVLRVAWARREADPADPDRPFRREIERRIAEADARFAEPGRRGALTERGRVLVLLGEPSLARPSADLRRETWFYRRERLPEALRRRVEPVTAVRFALDEDGRWRLDPGDAEERRAVEALLAAAAGAAIRRPELAVAPIPPLFPGAPPPGGGELAWLDAPWPGGAAILVRPELLPGLAPRAAVFLRLPAEAALADTAAGLVLGPDREAAGGFVAPVEGTLTARGTVYCLSVPVPGGRGAVRLALAAGGVAVAATELELELPRPPPNAFWISPVTPARRLLQLGEHRPWTPEAFGGYRPLPAFGGTWDRDETLFLLWNVIAPSGVDEVRLDLERELLLAGRTVAHDVQRGLEPDIMAPRTWLLATSLPLAALPGPGRYTLRLTVRVPGAAAARSDEVTLEVR